MDPEGPSGAFSFPPLPILPTAALIGRMSDRDLLVLCVRYLSAIPHLRDLYERVWIAQVANEDRLTRAEDAIKDLNDRHHKTARLAASAYRKAERTGQAMTKRKDLPDIDDSQIIEAEVVEQARKGTYDGEGRVRSSEATFLRGVHSVWKKAWPEAVKYVVTAIIVSIAWAIWHFFKSGHAP